MRTPHSLLNEPAILYELADLLQTIDAVLEVSEKPRQDYQPKAKPLLKEGKLEAVGIGTTEYSEEYFSPQFFSADSF